MLIVVLPVGIVVVVADGYSVGAVVGGWDGTGTVVGDEVGIVVGVAVTGGGVGEP